MRMTTPIGLTRAEFARQMDVHRSSVTRWAEAGRLVLLTDGSVDAEASRQRILATSGGRDDVAARHAAGRMAPPTAQPGAQPAAAGATPPAGAISGAAEGGSITPPVDNAPGARFGETRADAQARKESAAADLLEIELAEKRASLLPREDVETAFRALGAQVRAALDGLPDQLAPLVAPVGDLDECHALISDAARGVLHQLAHQLDRARAELAREAGK